MNELIERIKTINDLSELENIDFIDPNLLFLATLKSERYGLLKNSRISLTNNSTLYQLTDYIFSDEDILYNIYQSGYSFSEEEINFIFKIIYEKYQESYQFDNFFTYFFKNKDSLNNFIKENENLFITYLHKNKLTISYILRRCDSFVEIILKEGYVKLINNLENYSLSNLLLLAQIINNGASISYYLGDDRFLTHLFKMKSELNISDFCKLLTIFKDKSSYNKKNASNKISNFDRLITENIDYLINLVDETNIVPGCLVESIIFRDECIKRNRIDLAVLCVLPENIFQDDMLSKKYADELKIDVKDFYERGKWIIDYYKKNTNIFNTFVATTLKDNIFNINKEHIERFINDVSIQISLRNLNDKENVIFCEIIKKYNYNEYDISSMITNILNNIKGYQSLINSIDIPLITDKEIRNLIEVLQIENNPFNIVNMDDLNNYHDKKRNFFQINYSKEDINLNKDNLLKYIFNISLSQAKSINNQFCYDRGKKVIDLLSNSELPKEIFNYLVIINKIVETNKQEYLINIYNEYQTKDIYRNEVPFEAYLRSNYTKLYNDKLFKINFTENNKEIDSIYKIFNYGEKEIKICIPRNNFNFLVHCVGSCSLASDIVDVNYQKDWCDRPQIQDHLLACSYINEHRIYSTISNQSIILGFDSLENGSLFGMGDTDIDSIGYYSRLYSPSKDLMEGNGLRAHYFVPSLLVKSSNDGHNEIVVERRNCNINKKEFKKSPDYIIMMAESLEHNNFTCLKELFNKELSFVNLEDRELILEMIPASKLKDILTKYEETLIQIANTQNIDYKDLVKNYLSLIIKAKYFEDCLKAANEFNIPLIVIDKLYYFKRLLNESKCYDEETISRITKIYIESNEQKKKSIFNAVATKKGLSTFFEKQEKSNQNSIRFSVNL